MAMSKSDNLRNEMRIISMDQLVPKDHIVRKLKKGYDWKSIYPKVKHCYSLQGRPSIDPVIFFKLLMLYFLSEDATLKQICEQVQVNLAYRYFLCLQYVEVTPSYMSLMHAYQRKFSDDIVFDDIVQDMVQSFVDKKLLTYQHVLDKCINTNDGTALNKLFIRISNDIQSMK